MLLWFPATGVVAARLSGFVNGVTAKDVYARIDAQPLIPYEGFLDLSGAAGFDWDARMQVIRWNVKHLNPQMSFHVRTQERFVVASRFLSHLMGRRVEFHFEEASFVSAYTLALKRKARRVGSSCPPPRDSVAPPAPSSPPRRFS